MNETVTLNIVEKMTVTSSNDIQTNDDIITSCFVFDFSVEFVLFGFLCVFGIAGNATFIYFLLRETRQTVTHLLLTWLAMADIGFLLCAIPLRVFATAVQTWNLEALKTSFPYIVKFIFPLSMLFQMFSIYMTLLLALTRFVALQVPRFARFCTRRFTRFNVVAVFVFCACVNIPRFVEYELVQHADPDTNKTQVVAQETEFARSTCYRVIYSFLIYCVIMFLVPLTSLSYINFRLYTFVRQQVVDDKQRSGERDVTRSLVAIVIVFIVCQLPAVVTQLLQVSLTAEQMVCPSAFFYYARISDTCVVINSVVNVIIYAACVSHFRKRMREALCCFRQEVEDQMEVELKHTDTAEVNTVNEL